MKKTEEQQSVSDFLSVDPYGRLIGEEQLLQADPKSEKQACPANILVISFFVLTATAIGGVVLLLNFHESLQLTAEWISAGLLFLTLLLPIVFFFAVLRFLLR